VQAGRAPQIRQERAGRQTLRNGQSRPAGRAEQSRKASRGRQSRQEGSVVQAGRHCEQNRQLCWAERQECRAVQAIR
jgi:hypothetical protein